MKALEVISSTKIDVVLLAMQMPLLNGIETMRRIRDLPAKPLVLVLTQFDDEALITYMLHLGANGFLSKDCNPEELDRAILSLMEIGYFVNELTTHALQNNIFKDQPSIEFSGRELEVLIFLKDGKTNKDISKKLNLSVHTIESYRKNLMKKTHCRNTAEVVSLAFRTGMVI